MEEKLISNEFARKSVHLLSLLVPCAAWYSLTGTLFGIMAFSILYGISEYCKIKNKSFLLQSLISKMQREDEKKRFAKAPLFLAVGVSAVLLLYSPLAAWVAIYHAGFCDTMASVFGKKWGKTRIPFSPEKSLLGSGLFFLSALPVLFLILPYSKAVVVALVATFLEMLPFKDWDNLIVPLVTGFLVEQFLFPMEYM
ncbi:MAG: hypothetical protein A3G32_06200 [Deltaproteobacteria bacterium RIFCSPLOWO2_12_FULL_40_28]|nr:MAG: hypothetical protein A3C45_02295 [Deltaproteobacteria bacterium RIFCSPHIGHO2_02_FULL_40_28]OGQ19046.1 MAG: hypothetical protein A3E27_05385 [Deltaproteobacteria bacterium RIFCSPHIGHO2_12_FULL_40_32]OGQ40218.1 MAG: hypothetical protein A3I69_00825 [Deltaproteobacteria bacterium RIFCSPLOWO2_02_FULL_40_36]OGQ53489.1 MAG: hypothetical protein A3G32_06200 [Deltaproteobacteria bacterium RIFCSPLOWO2_12_FULL_40_28]